KGIDFKITEKHKIVYETQQGNIIKKEATYLKDKIGKKYGQINIPHHLPYNNTTLSKKTINLENYIDNTHLVYENNLIRDFNHSKSRKYPYVFKIEDFVELIGWYVTEGSYSSV